MKMYRINGQGETPVSRQNAAFTIFCDDRHIIDQMEIGETRTVRFHSGAGRTVTEVTRVADKDD